MDDAPSATAKNPFADVAPVLGEYTNDILFGEVWERPGLSKRERSLITVATLIAGYRQNELYHHVKIALQNGLTREELGEVITHMAFYASWPCANTAVNIARTVYAEIDSEHQKS